jgi:dolichyl-phosphate-mannose-protein mannosyltransferase
MSWWRSLIALGITTGLACSTTWGGFMSLGMTLIFTGNHLWKIVTNPAIPLNVFHSHFVSRIGALIVLPLSIFLACYSLHFSISVNSGPGSDLMSSRFQSTLNDAKAPKSFSEVGYHSDVVLRHANVDGYLHSHSFQYPGGSKQQQITLYAGANDINNVFTIWPELKLNDDVYVDQPIEGFVHVIHGDTVRLIHLATKKKLHSHNVRFL